MGANVHPNVDPTDICISKHPKHSSFDHSQVFYLFKLPAPESRFWNTFKFTTIK